VNTQEVGLQADDGAARAARRFDELLARPGLTKNERALLGLLRTVLQVARAYACSAEQELGDLRAFVASLDDPNQLDGEAAAREAHRESLQGLLEGTTWPSDDPMRGHGVVLGRFVAGKRWRIRTLILSRERTTDIEFGTSKTATTS
jgi:hypothetical protein